MSQPAIHLTDLTKAIEASFRHHEFEFDPVLERYIFKGVLLRSRETIVYSEMADKVFEYIRLTRGSIEGVTVEARMIYFIRMAFAVLQKKSYIVISKGIDL